MSTGRTDRANRRSNRRNSSKSRFDKKEIVSKRKNSVFFTEETVLEIKRQSIVDMQKVLSQNEQKSNESLLREREQSRRISGETKTSNFDDNLSFIHRHDETNEVRRTQQKWFVVAATLKPNSDWCAWIWTSAGFLSKSRLKFDSKLFTEHQFEFRVKERTIDCVTNKFRFEFNQKIATWWKILWLRHGEGKDFSFFLALLVLWTKSPGNLFGL